MTTIKQANTLKDLAKIILEEQEKGLYPVSFSLPNVEFSDTGERAELSPNLQAIIEENMSKLESGKGTILNLSLKGLIDVVEGRGKVESGKDLKIKIGPMGDITCVMFSEEPNVSRLSYNDLIKFRKILDSVCYPKNTQWKYVKFATLKRLSKLKGEAK